MRLYFLLITDILKVLKFIYYSLFTIKCKKKSILMALWEENEEKILNINL